jgi:hypothetical protein
MHKKRVFQGDAIFRPEVLPSSSQPWLAKLLNEPPDPDRPVITFQNRVKLRSCFSSASD